ncbi:hypothetical protein KPL78_00925 [Roseomonas sp. HJA6]|uniref:Uncharacterized protein n=1 Tax=Roseomonas alba TaxID=2846776 RepID=A0ABS7A2J3_9PROT|nr:hypothetical protein [Neoroseomonas alba]MBW6396383.1 hypothetical protein [Neoroseomonas alba]
MTADSHPTNAGPSAAPSGQEVWQMCLAQDHMTFQTLEEELVVALLTWAAQQPGDGPVPAAHQPLMMRIDDFIDKVGCAHIHSDVLAKLQAEMWRRGVRYRFTDEAGAADGGAWVQVWLDDYLALGLPGMARQLRRSRGWFVARALDSDVRRRMAEAALAQYGEGPPDAAQEVALLAALRRVRHEQARIRDAMAQMTDAQVEPEA